jgi:hypothetical protein
VNGLDLRLRRKIAAFEAVDANDGVRARELEELALQLGGIIRQRLDVLVCQLRAERRGVAVDAIS